MMTRMMRMIVLVAALGLWARPGQAQVFNITTNRQLISFVSFYMTTNQVAELGRTLIASLTNNHIEVHQLWLRRLDSLVSIKLQQGQNGPFTSFDLTAWQPLKSFDVNGAPPSDDPWPFGTTLNVVPPQAALGDSSREQYWFRLESGTQLQLYTRGGPATIYGFARFKYQPAYTGR